MKNFKRLLAINIIACGLLSSCGSSKQTPTQDLQNKTWHCSSTFRVLFNSLLGTEKTLYFKMKKCILLGMSLMFIALCIGLTSCGKDGEEDEITGGTDGTVASYFIGKWKQSDVNQVWTFNADGTCVKDYTGHYNYHDEGTWHYVPETKTLITDIGSWILVIISTSDNQWTGMTVNSKKAFTYNRVNK